MPIDPQQVGAMALAFMEHLESQHGNDAELEAIAFIATVSIAPGAGQTQTHFSFRAGNGEPLARYRALGLLAEVDRNV